MSCVLHYLSPVKVHAQVLRLGKKGCLHDIDYVSDVVSVEKRLLFSSLC